MKSSYYTELMETPPELHSVDSLVHASNLEMGDLDDDDAITHGQYRDLKEKWDTFRGECKTELIRRVESMMCKFAKYGDPGIRAMNEFNDLSNVTIENESAIHGIFEGWDSYRFYTEDLFGHDLKYLWVNMKEYFRGECDEVDYHFPLEFLKDDFDPMTNEKTKAKILEFQTKCDYDSAIPVNPTMDQRKRFLEEYNKDENFKVKIDAIFAKDDNHE